MAFHFQLQTLLNYRRSLEELAQNELARQHMLLEKHRMRQVELEATKEHLGTELEERQRQGLLVSIQNLYLAAARRLELSIVQQKATVMAQTKVVEKARRKVMEKMKEREVIERARERAYHDYVKADLRARQHESDEQVLLRFGRNTEL